MNAKFDSKKLIPHLIAIGVFYLLTAIYFSPMVFGDKELVQSDILQATGVSKEIADFRKDNNEAEPYWTSSVFAGMPAYQVSAKYFVHILQNVHEVLSLYLPHPVRFNFLAFAGMYLLLLVLGVNNWVAFAGSLAYGLSSYFFIIIEAGHNSKMAAISYMAPVLAGVILLYRGRLLLGGALTAFFLTMELFCNHPQITYYLGLMVMAYIIFQAVSTVRTKDWMPFLKSSGIAAGAAVIALSVNVTGLWATAELGKYTIRGASELTLNPDGSPKEANATTGLDRDYILQYSYGVSETMTILIPNYKGGSSSDAIGKVDASEEILSNLDPQSANIASQVYTTYFGDQPIVSGPVYFGAIVVFLFVLGLFIVPGTLKWVMLVCTLLSFVLAWGKHDPTGITNFMLDYFPMYNKFRAVSMTLVIAGLAMPLLGILAVDRLFRTKNFLSEQITLPFNKMVSGQQALIYSFLITGGFCLLTWISPGMFNEFTSAGDRSQVSYLLQSNQWPEDQIQNFLNTTIPAAAEVRAAAVKADALRSFIFILLAAGLLWAHSKNILSNPKLAAGGLAILALIDLGGVDKRYINNDSFTEKREAKNPFARLGRPHAADLQILQDTEPNFRVWNTLARPDQDGITSYWHKSLGGYSGAKLRRYQELIDFHINRRNMKVINMLNTKYFIFQGEDNSIQTYPNPDRLGNAWFINDVSLVANPDSEITALNRIDPATTVVVDQRFSSVIDNFKPHKDSSSSITLTSFKPNHLVYESNNAQEGLAVFSEIYYPSGWNVTIDGQAAEHFRANYVLRAMKLPAGKHTIEFKFEPDIVKTGDNISMAATGILLLLCAFAGYKELTSSTTTADTNSE